MAELRWGSASDAGQLRSQNEDNLHAGPGLFVVADGMGGHLAGEIASEMAVTRLDERLSADGDHTLTDLVEAITDANTEIYDGSITDLDRAGMGTTVTAIAVVSDPHDGEAFGVANVGDSRGYVFRHGRLRQITIDHSFVQELIAEGAISREDARIHPRRNIVTRALGIEPAVRVDSWTMPIIRGDRFVLCSDGLVDEITDDEITRILQAHADDPDQAAAALVEAANEAGGRDNVSVVVVDVLEGDDPPDPTEEFDVVPLWNEDDGEDTGEVQIIADPADPEDAERGGATVLPAATAQAAAARGGVAVATTAPAETETEGGPDSTTDDELTPKQRRKLRRRRRGARVVRFMLALGVAAVLVLGFAILAAWARGGYYVDFDENGEVVIYQGRSVLWFEPTREATGQYTRDQLDEASIDAVENGGYRFDSQTSAARFVSERLSPTTTTTTTTVAPITTTTSPTTAASGNTATATGTTSPTTAASGNTATATGTTTGG